MTFFNSFKKSAAELKDLGCVVVTAVLIGLDLVLKTFVNVEITNELKLNFAFIAVASIGMLYGPTVAGMACVVTDILGYLIKPSGGGFSPLFTLVEAAGGVLYGLFLYRMTPVKPDLSSTKAFAGSLTANWRSVMRIVAAKLTVAVVCNLFMTPLFITITKTMEAGVFNADVFWTGFFTRVGTRLIKNAIEIPVHCLILMIALFPILAAYNSVFKKQRIVNG